LFVPGLAGAVLAESVWMTRLTGTYYWVVEAALIVVVCVAASAEQDGRWSRIPLAYAAAAAVGASLLFSPMPVSRVADRTNHAAWAARLVGQWRWKTFIDSPPGGTANGGGPGWWLTEEALPDRLTAQRLAARSTEINYAELEGL
jgi:hypothetical protein